MKRGADMDHDIIRNGTYIRHDDGVYLKHYFGSADNDQLNNLEIFILPNFAIEPHVHEDSAEFFYIVEGQGEFWHEGNWIAVEKGDTIFAPKNTEHGIRNRGKEPLIAFATISPPIE